MFELWLLKKQVNMYVRLIINKPEKARKNCEAYLQDAKLLRQGIENNIDITANEFETWCNSSVEVWMIEETSLSLRLKRKALMGIVNYHLNKLSGEMATLGILQRNMDFVCTRLNQFYSFTLVKKGSD